MLEGMEKIKEKLLEGLGKNISIRKAVKRWCLMEFRYPSPKSGFQAKTSHELCTRSNRER